MAEAIISRNVPRVKTGTLDWGQDASTTTLTIPALVGARNAVVALLGARATRKSMDMISSFVIEDGVVTAVAKSNDTLSDGTHIDALDVSYMQFDSTTGSITVSHSLTRFGSWAQYKYIVY